MPVAGGNVICSLLCARSSVGAAAWFAWFEQECRDRIRKRNGKVIEMHQNPLDQIA